MRAHPCSESPSSSSSSFPPCSLRPGYCNKEEKLLLTQTVAIYKQQRPICTGRGGNNTTASRHVSLKICSKEICSRRLTHSDGDGCSERACRYARLRATVRMAQWKCLAYIHRGVCEDPERGRGTDARVLGPGGPGSPRPSSLAIAAARGKSPVITAHQSPGELNQELLLDTVLLRGFNAAPSFAAPGPCLPAPRSERPYVQSATPANWSWLCLYYCWPATPPGYAVYL